MFWFTTAVPLCDVSARFGLLGSLLRWRGRTRRALIRLRGLADHFEKEDPAMHKTNTVDHSVVYDGEIWLELDNSETLHLKRGDVVVQNGTRHAWRNKGTQPVTMLFFLNGAKA